MSQQGQLNRKAEAVGFRAVQMHQVQVDARQGVKFDHGDMVVGHIEEPATVIVRQYVTLAHFSAPKPSTKGQERLSTRLCKETHSVDGNAGRR